MKELFEILNETPGDRIFGYVLGICGILYVIFWGLFNIIRAFKNKGYTSL